MIVLDTPRKALHLERIYAAPQERVFKAWSSSEAVSRWFCLDPFGLDGLKQGAKTIAEIDFREGGVYVLNAGAYTVRGVFKEILPSEKISFTWLWDHNQEVPEMLVSIEFSPVNTGTNKGTKMTLILDHFADPILDQDPLEQHKYGWERTKILGEHL